LTPILVPPYLGIRPKGVEEIMRELVVDRIISGRYG
jgi:hypothetical protein